MADLDVKFDADFAADITPDNIKALVETLEKFLGAADSVAKSTFWTDKDDKAVAQAYVILAYVKAFMAMPWVPGAIDYVLGLLKKPRAESAKA